MIDDTENLIEGGDDAGGDSAAGALKALIAGFEHGFNKTV
jgi:hypothetical protein